MARAFSKLPHELDREALTCRVIIETPAGSRAKYKYDEECAAFELFKMLPASMNYPLNFGFVPSTLGEDGDPIDVLVMSEIPLAIGCIARVRLLGAMLAEQSEKGETIRNDRLIARLEEGEAYAGIKHVDQLGDPFTRERERSLTPYKDGRGRGLKVFPVEGPEEAPELIAKGALG